MSLHMENKKAVVNFAINIALAVLIYLGYLWLTHEIEISRQASPSGAYDLVVTAKENSNSGCSRFKLYIVEHGASFPKNWLPLGVSHQYAAPVFLSGGITWKSDHLIKVIHIKEERICYLNPMGPPGITIEVESRPFNALRSITDSVVEMPPNKSFKADSVPLRP